MSHPWLPTDCKTHHHEFNFSYLKFVPIDRDSLFKNTPFMDSGPVGIALPAGA